MIFIAFIPIGFQIANQKNKEALHTLKGSHKMAAKDSAHLP
jgi:hypothetical protein